MNFGCSVRTDMCTFLLSSDSSAASARRLVADEAQKLQQLFDDSRRVIQSDSNDAIEALENRCADRFNRNGKSIDAVMTGIDASDEQDRERLAAVENQISSLQSRLEALVQRGTATRGTV